VSPKKSPYNWRNRYPKNWEQIREKVRARSGNRCEGKTARGRCTARHGKPHPKTGSNVVLAVAHKNHKRSDVRLANLAHLCQLCHNTMDGSNRNRTIKRNKNKPRTLSGARRKPHPSKARKTQRRKK